MKRFYLVFIALAISISFLYSVDFADSYYSSINNIFDAYEGTVIVKRVTAADSVMGTGFFVSEDYLVTNASTVGTSQFVKVNIRDNDYDAYVIAVHYYLDFALLKVDGYTSFRTFTLERYNADMQDNRGTILNYPQDRIMETTGAILTNSIVYDNDALFQVDISMPSGRVDGPILNAEHRLIGFLMSNNIKRDFIDTNQFIPNSVYLAVKSDYILPIIQIYTKVAVYYQTPQGGVAGLTPDPGIVLASKSGVFGSSSVGESGRPVINVSIYDNPNNNLSVSEAINPGRPPVEFSSETQGGDTRIRNTPSNMPDIGENDIPDNEKARRERAEKERASREKLARERVQNQRIQQDIDQQNRLDRERAQREQAEKERLQKAQNEARERQDRERAEREQAEIDRINREKIQKLQAEKDRQQREQAAERERNERERIQAAERERTQRALEAENQRISRERTEREQAAQRERARQEQIQAAEREQQERAERERQQNELNLQNNSRDNATRRQ